MNNIYNGNLLLQLRDMQEEFTPVGRQLCSFILSDPARVLSMSIQDLSQASKTSGAAVMRFCKALGYDGYRAFIVSLSAAITSAEEPDTASAFTDIQPGDDLETIVKSISASNHQSINDTIAILNRNTLEQAVERLLHANRIIFCGMGASALVCMDAEQKFMRIGKLCSAHMDGHSQLTAAALLGPQDVAVLFSNSGETNDIIDTLNMLNKRGVCSIALTRYSRSRLATGAQLVLHISTPEIYMRSGAMGSRIAMLNLVDILYAGVVSRDYDRATHNLALTRESLSVKHG